MNKRALILAAGIMIAGAANAAQFDFVCAKFENGTSMAQPLVVSTQHNMVFIPANSSAVFVEPAGTQYSLLKGKVAVYTGAPEQLGGNFTMQVLGAYDNAVELSPSCKLAAGSAGYLKDGFDIGIY